MKDMMKVNVLQGTKQFEYTEREKPSPQSGEVLVKVDVVGICGSDLTYYEHGRIGDFIVEDPLVLGHEVSGTVVELGEGVTTHKVGDRVALEPNITCGECEACRRGEYNLCPDVEFFATPPIDGVFQEFVTHPAYLSFILPDEVDQVEGAMVEPLAVGFHAASQGNATIGQSAVVVGTGCIGLMSFLALKARGLSEIYVVDVLPNRLKVAKEMGAREVINSKEEDVVSRIMELTHGRGIDLVIECSGNETASNQAIDYLRMGGTMVFIGYHGGPRSLDIDVALNKELSFKTGFRYRHNYPQAIEAIASGLCPVKQVVSKSYTFDEIPLAFEEGTTKKEEIVKAVIDMR